MEQKPSKPWYKRWWAIALGVFLAIGFISAAVSPPPEEDSAGSSAPAQESPPPPAGGAREDASASDDQPAPEGDADCGKQATDDCTPHVGFGGSVRVDALVWKVQDVQTATTLGDQQYGLGAKANGRFVIVTLRVHSDKNESATLTDNAFQLEVEGNKYDTDSDGTIAAMGAGEEPFFLEDIGPDSDVTGKVVFDVPESVFSKKVEMRFNELGFGTTHGYIDITSQLG